MRRFGGLIPAHAGKTRLSMWITIPGRAHPRSRGENAYQSRARDIFKGSSPLTRGKHIAENLRRPRRGLIPAHAGKTTRRRASSAALPAHPRSRGENTVGVIKIIKRTGSSPLTRGKRRSEDIERNTHGLIPAHAGKTPSTSTRSTRSGAHPRSRGENVPVPVQAFPWGGSSPLTRGKLLRLSERCALIGLIPAHAGKTL